MDIGEPVRAALDLTAAAELDPSDGEIPAMRGLTFMTRSLYDAAIADFTKALESLVGDPRMLYDRATAYLEEDEQHLAQADLSAFSALDRMPPGRSVCGGWLASIWVR